LPYAPMRRLVAPPPAAPATSLEGRAAPIARDNGITAARLGLALVVIASHSFGLTGHLEPLVNETGRFSIGLVAVIGFFSLSGWLLTASREKNNVRRFVENRARRILPGYWLALGLGGLVVAWAGGDGSRYVATNLSILIPGSPAMPDGSEVNGSLWTLAPELICYGVLALSPRQFLRPVAVAWTITLTVLWPWLTGVETMLFLAFAVGASIRLFGLSVTPARALGAGLLAVPTFALGPVPIILAAYAALGLAHLPLRVERDLSYGSYVFAFPVQQVLAVQFDTLGVLVGTILIVLPMAWLSWTFVESRALGLRRQRHADRTAVRPAGSFKLTPGSMRTVVLRMLLR
jgi:peptidoglycan/LPS O-acetylase OafA/YrhL